MCSAKLKIINPVLCLAALLLVAATFGCRLLPPNATEVSGGVLVRHGAYLYRIGGKNYNGSVASTILMAKISLDDAGKPQPLQWEDTTPLPEGRAFAAAFAAGNIMYVLGGEGKNGSPSSAIYFTAINADTGALGFGGEVQWAQTAIPLPEPRSRMAFEFYDGRVFLIGGTTDDGAADTIIHARLYPDLQTGQWYASPQKLASARFGAASAIHNDSLVVAGGIDDTGTVLDDMATYAIGACGLLENLQTAQLPKALYAPVLLSDKDSLILAGGYDTALAGSEAVYRYSGGSWADVDLAIKAEGPTAGRTAGDLWYVKQAKRRIFADVVQQSGMNLALDRPIVIPGSGLVPKYSSVQVKEEPGTTLYYHAGIAASDSWEPLADIPMVTAPADYTIGSFSPSYPSDTASPTVKRSFRTRSTGLLVYIAGQLEPKAQGSGLDTLYLRENPDNASSPALSSIWCRLTVPENQQLQLVFADNDSVAGGAYSGRVKLSLYETDLYTEALDINGLPVFEYTTAAMQPVELALQSGSYYLLIEDLDGLTGRSLGLAFYGQ